MVKLLFTISGRLLVRSQFSASSSKLHIHEHVHMQTHRYDIMHMYILSLTTYDI